MNKLPTIKAKFINEVDMIGFEKIYNWDCLLFTGFQYDDISDKMIEEALLYNKFDKIDISKGWEDDDFLEADTSISDDIKHAIRVAALVMHIRDGGGVNPVNLDTFTMNVCRSCISDGHHRIRALQYLGYTHFPAYCSGEVKLLKCLIDRRINKKMRFLALFA